MPQKSWRGLSRIQTAVKRLKIIRICPSWILTMRGLSAWLEIFEAPFCLFGRNLQRLVCANLVQNWFDFLNNLLFAQLEEVLCVDILPKLAQIFLCSSFLKEEKQVRSEMEETLGIEGTLTLSLLAILDDWICPQSEFEVCLTFILFIN